MPRDKAGNVLTWKEFFARWKQGIQQVTPLQQLKSSLFGYIIVFAGIIWGIVMAIILKQYWLMTILIGSFVITAVQVLGTYQKYAILSKIEKEVQHVQEDIFKSA